MTHNEGLTARWTEDDKARLAKAVRHVVGAVTVAPGMDCRLYAVVGAALLRRCGVDAVAQAGSAIWRIGPGAGDLITHAPEAAGQVYAAAGADGLSMLMHAWIRVTTGDGRNEIVDLTTWQLARKARDLDAEDGGHTPVEFCPDFLWVPQSVASRLTPREVAQSYDVGVFSYVAKAAETAFVVPASLEDELQPLISAAALCFLALRAGHMVQVLGVDEEGLQESNESAPLKLVPLGAVRRN